MDALQRLSDLEAAYRLLASLYSLDADSPPDTILRRAQAEHRSVDRLLSAVAEVNDSRLAAITGEIRASTGRTVQGEVRAPATAPSRYAAAGFEVINPSTSGTHRPQLEAAGLTFERRRI